MNFKGMLFFLTTMFLVILSVTIGVNGADVESKTHTERQQEDEAHLDVKKKKQEPPCNISTPVPSTSAELNDTQETTPKETVIKQSENPDKKKNVIVVPPVLGHGGVL